MLILTRKVGEAIVIDGQIAIKVLEIKGGQIKLGVEAPNHITVHRQEVLSRIQEENQKAAASGQPTDLNGLTHLIEQRNRRKTDPRLAGASSRPDSAGAPSPRNDAT